MKIKSCIFFDKKNNKRYFKHFHVFKDLPVFHSIICDDDINLIVCSVHRITLPSEQPHSNVFLYDYYYVTYGYVNVDNFTIYDYFSMYICVKKEVI